MKFPVSSRVSGNLPCGDKFAAVYKHKLRVSQNAGQVIILTGRRGQTTGPAFHGLRQDWLMAVFERGRAVSGGCEPRIWTYFWLSRW